MKNNIISVHLYGKEVCKLIWQGGYRQGFGKVGAQISFNPEYKTFGFDVDPLGPYRTSTYLVRKGMSDICRQNEYEGLPRFLSCSLPDDWGNQVFAQWIEAHGIRAHDVTAVDKLAFIGKRGMGGFEFIPQLYDQDSESDIILEDLYNLAKEIELSREDTTINIGDNPGINDLMSVGMSAGGKHPKAIIAIDWETGTIRSGQVLLPKNFTQHILKFKDSATWPTGEIEYSYYLMAQKCGIQIERSSLLKAGGENHFLTERFDRRNGEKIHAATLRSLCGEVTVYDDIFRICRTLHTPYNDMEQMFRRTVFNYLTGVSDDHDKNFSFTMSKDGKWRLAPAYDLTFTVNYKNRFIGDRHAMSIKENDRNISGVMFLKLAEENDVRNGKDIINEIAEIVSGFESMAKDIVGDYHTSLISEYIKSQVKLL